MPSVLLVSRLKSLRRLQELRLCTVQVSALAWGRLFRPCRRPATGNKPGKWKSCVCRAACGRQDCCPKNRLLEFVAGRAHGGASRRNESLQRSEVCRIRCRCAVPVFGAFPIWSGSRFSTLELSSAASSPSCRLVSYFSPFSLSPPSCWMPLPPGPAAVSFVRRGGDDVCMPPGGWGVRGEWFGWELLRLVFVPMYSCLDVSAVVGV